MDNKQIEDLIEHKIDHELKNISLISLIQSDWKNISAIIKFILVSSAVMGFGFMEAKTFLVHSLRSMLG